MTTGAPGEALGALAEAVAALGTAHFAAQLLAALNRGLVVDHLSLMRFEDRQRAPVLEFAVWRGGRQVAEVQRAYLGGLYRADPNLVRGAAGVIVRRLRRDDIADPAYRDTCYRRSHLLERLSVVAPDCGGLVALNLYRRDESGGFADAEVAAVESLSPMLAALALKHAGMVGTLLRSRSRADRLTALDARLAALDPHLTRRERDVLARILAGLTTEGIALDLKISANTVLTYRKRAYRRLDVTSQSQLFSLCMA